MHNNIVDLSNNWNYEIIFFSSPNFRALSPKYSIFETNSKLLGILYL